LPLILRAENHFAVLHIHKMDIHRVRSENQKRNPQSEKLVVQWTVSYSVATAAQEIVPAKPFQTPVGLQAQLAVHCTRVPISSHV
jgi:hypothetical protein